MFLYLKIFKGEALEKIMNLTNTLVKQVDAYTLLDCNLILRIYIICVHPSHKKKGLESVLLENCIRMAITSKISAVTGIFTSNYNQKLAKKFCFRVLREIYYSRWFVDDETVYTDPGTGNYSVAFMGVSTSAMDYPLNSYEIEEDKS